MVQQIPYEGREEGDGRRHRKAKAVGYGRMSTAKQELSLDVQKDQVEKYYEWALKPNGITYVGWFTDPAVSAATPFRDREAGRRAFDSLMPGDHLLVSRFDRAFRNALDAFQVLHDLRKRKIVVHLIDKRIDTGTSTGRMLFQILGIFAEWERSWISERTKDAIARVLGEPGVVRGPNSPPLGWKAVKVKGKTRANGKPFWELVPDVEELRLMRQLWRLVRNGESYQDIARKLDRMKIQKKLRPSLLTSKEHAEWSAQTVYRYELKYRQMMEAGKIPEEALPSPEELSPSDQAPMTLEPSST